MIVGQTATRVIDCVDNLSLQRDFAMERFTCARWSARAGSAAHSAPREHRLPSLGLTMAETFLKTGV